MIARDVKTVHNANAFGQQVVPGDWKTALLPDALHLSTHRSARFLRAD
jgi:hypothetical protein